MSLWLSWLACVPATIDSPLPGADADVAATGRVRALVDGLAAVRDLPEPASFPVRVLSPGGWALWQGQQAVSAGRDDHALALAAVGLIESPEDLARQAARGAAVVAWDRTLGALIATQEGLAQDALVLAAADSVLPTCEPAAWTWDAMRVAEAVQDGMAVVLAWQRDLHEAGLPDRGLVIDPSLPLARWPADHGPVPTALARDDDALRALGTDVVLRLLDAGQWRSADLACQKLPSSTAALLHPERWREAVGPDPVGPAEVPEWSERGWGQVHTDRLGEASLASWLAWTARVATPEQASTLAAGWRGDALSVWQQPGEAALRGAWTINLAPEARRELARLLHGRVLTDGRIVDVRPGPGDALVLLIGGSGRPLVTVLEAARGGAVAVRLGPAVDVAGWERTLRLEAAPVSADDGVARVGDFGFPLDDTWVASRRGMDGEVLSLRHRGTRLRLELYAAPTLLVGPPDTAAERVARLMADQHGLARPVHLRSVGACSVATVLGRDRNGRNLEIRVHTVPSEHGTLIARASYEPRSVPLSYHRLVRSLEDARCRGPIARRDYSSPMDGQ